MAVAFYKRGNCFRDQLRFWFVDYCGTLETRQGHAPEDLMATHLVFLDHKRVLGVVRDSDIRLRPHTGITHCKGQLFLRGNRSVVVTEIEHSENMARKIVHGSLLGNICAS